MEYQKFPQGIVLRLDPGEEVMECLTKVAGQENIKLGCINALGAANDVTIGIFDLDKKEFCPRRYEGQYEVSALVGSITRQEGKPYLHLHITIGNPVTGEVYAGHMARCVISATAELFIHVWDGEVGRKFDDKTGLNLFSF